VKDRIIEGSVELFLIQGVRHTTMDDIAQHIGISKRTIYENFDDKEGLLDEVVSFVYQENKKYFLKVFEESNNVIEAFVKILEKGAEKSFKNEHAIFEELKKYHPNVYKRILSCNEYEKQTGMQQFVVMGINQGVFRDDLNPDIIAYIFSKQSEGLFMVSKNKDFQNYSMRDIFKNMIITFIRGLCTYKGIEILDNVVK
jgi:AcrR family transcriptional regulator